MGIFSKLFGKQAKNNTQNLPSLLLIVYDSTPENKDAFVHSVLNSLHSPLIPGALIDLHQYDYAQSLEHALPFAIALATRYAKENPYFNKYSLDLDVDRTIYEKVKRASSTKIIHGHVFMMFFKLKTA